ncbi:unnamed protein product [Protopolystoma xenopodis]|uniref:Reverse transcriptase domain-containing protein n=1 Tax=Protopolystoma xenopodis TaxID=117903 RepID=A0A448WT44_9PLAT|nr:unnamed protein product [Protopolystoma xenopodis]
MLVLFAHQRVHGRPPLIWSIIKVGTKGGPVAATVPDIYPLPHVTDIALAPKGRYIFSKITKKTTIIISFDFFRFNMISFWLINAAQTYQRLMDEVTCGVGVFVYTDDILAANDNLEQQK